MRKVTEMRESGRNIWQEKRRGLWPRALVELFLFLALALLVTACQDRDQSSFPGIAQVVTSGGPVEEDEAYSRLEDVALYIMKFSTLPPNYHKKEEALSGGWKTSDAPGAIIGGNRFGNREGLLPKKEGRTYYEADIMAGYTDHRGPQRLVYSNDGLIFFTDDHYDHFVQIIPKERSPR